MTEGYIYCFSNVSMPNILKVGMTEQDPEIKLNEANICNTWGPPTPYKIVIAKKVINPKQKKYTLHKILSKYGELINTKQDFFRISIEDVKTLFDLIDGDLWIKNRGCCDIDMATYFIDGQRIRHITSVGKTTWIGIYNSSDNSIIHNDKIYTSLSNFANAHYMDDGFKFHCSANGWKECEYEVKKEYEEYGVYYEWVSTYNIK